MKKTAIILISLLATLAAQAQVTFGVRAGGALTKITAMELDGDKFWKFKNVLTPTVGLMASKTLNEKLDLQAELNYAMRGFKERVNVADGVPGGMDFYQSEYKIRSSYLELPVLLKFYPASRFNIQAGPQVGVLLGRHESLGKGLEGAQIFGSKDRKIDCGLNFGVGFEEGQWCLDFRYYLGLTKTYDTDADGLQNRGISMSIGYYFGR